MKRFTLYGSPHSLPTYKVALMLRMSGEPFSFRYVSFQKGMHKTPEFLALSRWGQVPVLIDGGHVHVQSSAIVEHLAEVLGQFQGHDAAVRQAVREWSAGILTLSFHRSGIAMAFSSVRRSSCLLASIQSLPIIIVDVPRRHYRP
jgi:glutathione S-transferase